MLYVYCCNQGNWLIRASGDQPELWELRWYTIDGKLQHKRDYASAQAAADAVQTQSTGFALWDSLFAVPRTLSDLSDGTTWMSALPRRFPT